jgi:hypothetical protein
MPAHDAGRRARSVIGTPGRPLDAKTRAFMEERFGCDFSAVRVHTDDAAASSANAINADAYTVGRDVIFAPGQYSPSTPSGQRLIAHELAHVVQQGGRAASGAGFAIGTPRSRLELAADKAAELATTAGPPAVASTAALSAGPVERLIQRQPAPAPQPETATGQKQGATPAPPTEKVEEPALPKAPLELWDRVEPVVDTELGFAWEDLGRAAIRQTNKQIQDFFGRFDRSATADQTFSDIINIAAGGGGNALADQLSPYAQLSGGIGGAVAQAVQVLLAHTLNTNEVGEAKSKAQEKAEDIEAEEFTHASAEFMVFEEAAIAGIEQEFDSWWQWFSGYGSHGPSEASEADKKVAVDIWRSRVRQEYSLNSDLAKGVLQDLEQAVDKILAPIEAPLRRKLRERRLNVGALTGGVTGALIGTALGAGLSRGSVFWGFFGGVAGFIAGEALGTAGAAIANWYAERKPPEPPETRRKTREQA